MGTNTEEPLPNPAVMLERLILRDNNAVDSYYLNPGIEHKLEFVGGRASDAISVIMYLLRKVDELEKLVKPGDAK